MIGGGPSDDEARKCPAVDAYGTNAMDAVKLAKQRIGAN